MLRNWRGDLTVRPSDFTGYSIGARFYPLLYVLTRKCQARDWWHGAPVLSAALLGKLNHLEVHHIFPKKVLYAAGYQRSEVNAVANFCYLTQATNLWIGARHPQEYFAQVEEHFPEALASQWMPMDPQLWRVARYREFLEARRELLAAAANNFLDGLLQHSRAAPSLAQPSHTVQVSATDDVDSDLLTLIDWLVSEGYARPEIDVEVVDLDGHVVAVAEAAWLNGLQPGLGEPILLEYELDDAGEERLAELGYRTFASTDSLRRFVQRSAPEVAAQA